MKSISIPGLFHCYRHERILLQNELEAIHGGGVARFSLSFDVRKIYRGVAPSASDVFGHYRYGKVFSQFDIPAVQETRIISDFSAIRNVCRIDPWNQFSIRLYLQNLYCWSPQDEVGDLDPTRLEGVYSQSVTFRHDLKGRYEIPSLGFYDSFFTGTQSLYPGRFVLSRGNQKARYLSSLIPSASGLAAIISSGTTNTTEPPICTWAVWTRFSTWSNGRNVSWIGQAI